MGVKRNFWAFLSVILSTIGFIIAFVGFGRFGNLNPSHTYLFTEREYAPHILTGSLAFLNIALMTVHSARGFKTLGLCCCVISLFSVFAAGISVDKDFHTISTGWREPGQPVTYSTPVNLNPFDNAGNKIYKCDATDLSYVNSLGQKIVVNAQAACKDIKCSASGNVIYVSAALISLVTIPMRMRSHLPATRNPLMFAGLFIVIVGWTIFMIGLAYFSHKYKDARSFGTKNTPSYIPSLQLWKQSEYSSLIIFCAVGFFSIITSLICALKVRLRSIIIAAVWAVISGYAAGAAFGYTGRIIHSGFSATEQAWGPPFGARGPVPCSYNSDMKKACEAIAVCCGGAAIFIFGVVLSYLACYFAITGDIVFGELNAQAWFNGQVWLTSYPLDKNNQPVQRGIAPQNN